MSGPGQFAARLPASACRRTHAAALVFGLAGTVLGMVVLWGLAPAVLGLPLELPTNTESLAYAVVLPFAAGLGAGVVAWPLWWLAVERPDESTPRRGGLVGAVVGVLAHPATWLFAGLGVGLVVLALRGPAAVAAEGSWTVRPLLWFSVWGFLFAGAVTVPVLAAVGAAPAHVRRRATAAGRERLRDW